MRSFAKILLSMTTFICVSVFGDTLSVVVLCSNGQLVPNLPVTVFDSNGQAIPNVDPTDSNGVFVINNSEMYAFPFYMYFTTPQGYECGSYYIYVDPQGMGQVALNYYPTELPCSCANLF